MTAQYADDFVDSPEYQADVIIVHESADWAWEYLGIADRSQRERLLNAYIDALRDELQKRFFRAKVLDVRLTHRETKLEVRDLHGNPMDLNAIRAGVACIGDPGWESINDILLVARNHAYNRALLEYKA